MMSFACLCGHREEADRTPICHACKTDMYGYVPPPWKPIGRVVAPIVAEIFAKAEGRGK